MKKVITIIVEGLPSDIKKKESELVALMAGEMVSYKSDVIVEPKKELHHIDVRPIGTACEKWNRELIANGIIVL